MMYEEIALYIDGEWNTGSEARFEDVVNPADETVLARLPHATVEDLDRALHAAKKGFEVWRNTGALERCRILRQAARILSERADAIAVIITLEQGKPLVESRSEMERVVETFQWNADEATRILSYQFPARSQSLQQTSRPEPLGVTVAITASNFPAILPARKLAPALAAGCSLILKAAEETPGTAVAIVRALADAGIPDGVVNLVFGVPHLISEHLLQSPTVRKLTFTGSLPVGKKLARLAAHGLKRCTFELGGHAPVIVFDDADVAAAAKTAARFKFRNAGQVCLSPGRFYVHEKVYDQFLEIFLEHIKTIKVGNGRAEDTTMGPLVNKQRVMAMQKLVSDAQRRGARVLAGGKTIFDKGFFWEPTVLVDVPDDAEIMIEEPFGPIAPFAAPFVDEDILLGKVNALPYGLASYVFTGSEATAQRMIHQIEAGGVAINTAGSVQPETPFCGVKESGYGYEGGREGIEAFMHRKLISQMMQ